jgi:aryl-alcohol dehydrogenase-like predicted oxidoreductase
MGGPGRDFLRNGEGFKPEYVAGAVEDSLKRLQTDHIDLYQLHWPQRGSYHFGQNWFYAAPGTDIAKQKTSEVVDNIHAMMDALAKQVKAGKIRYVGLSNETAWGTMQYLKLAEQHKLPRVVSMQNEYSLMYRPCDLDMAEVCLRENIGLLPYSPLAAGWLSGKYYEGARPEGSRFTFESYRASQRLTENAQKAADAYMDLARQHGLDPAQMALAFTLAQPFVHSTIIGATSLAQLETNIGAIDVELDETVMMGIHAIRQQYPMPY